MKSKMWNVFVMSVVVVMLLVAPACRKKQTVKPQTPADVVDQRPPVIPDPPVQTDTTATVEATRDFVQETVPAEEELPRDIEQLNKVAQERGYIRDAFYPYGEAALDADAQAALTTSADWLRRNPTYKVLVEGHCDERGTEQYNLALGDRRANSARDFLVTLGIDGGRVRTVSYGEERPFEEGHTESAYAQNRRAHLVLVR